MKEHPILFSGQMVRAILEGRKTMTRRVCKVSPEYRFKGLMTHSLNNAPPFKLSATFVEPNTNSGVLLDCPYGQVGDHLWVRETWAKDYDDSSVRYMADIKHPDKANYANRTRRGWKLSIYMPRAFSRITLEITKIRTERLQEITQKDAMKEGYDFSASGSASAIEWFKTLWDSINGKKYPWESNPWVWVIEFRRIHE